MDIRVGIAIGRRWASLLVVEKARSACSILLQREQVRIPGDSAADCLEALLGVLPVEYLRTPVSLALSAGELACSDTWDLPEELTKSAAAKLAAVLCEARCAGETLETLSLDVRQNDRSIVAVALRTDLLVALQRVASARGSRLSRITSLPAALADTFTDETPLVVRFGGEEISIERGEVRTGWRSFPIDCGEERAGEGNGIPWQGTSISSALAPAFAAALADSDRVPDALRGLPGAPGRTLERLRTPLVGLAAAATLFLLALGIHFQSKRAEAERHLVAVRALESDLWKRHWPARAPKEGGLLQAMRAHLRESGAQPGDAVVPSALSLWSEIGKGLPDVETLGMTLESLDLSPEGGKLVATLPVAPGDKLKNAGILEKGLNQSEGILVRGEYEAREKDVQVRLRIDARDRVPREGK